MSTLDSEFSWLKLIRENLIGRRGLGGGTDVLQLQDVKSKIEPRDLESVEIPTFQNPKTKADRQTLRRTDRKILRQTDGQTNMKAYR